MIVDREAALLGNAVLALLDFSVDELFDFAALQADQMIVVVAMIEFEYRLVAIEMVAHQQARLLELGEHAIHRGQSNVLTIVREQPIDFFRSHVTFVAVLE